MNILNFANSTVDASLSLKKEFSSDKSNDCIILSGFYCPFSINELRNKYGKIIVYNFEPYNKGFIKRESYVQLIKNADEVWDYDEENIKNLAYLRSDIKLHILKPFITIEPQEKEYDVLFYGATSQRRKFIIDSLQKNGISCKIFNERLEIYGDRLNEYISKARCLLNVKYDETYPQEQARMIRWVGNGKIFSEKSIHNHLGIDEYEYDRLVPEIIDYIRQLKRTEGVYDKNTLSSVSIAGKEITYIKDTMPSNQTNSNQNTTFEFKGPKYITVNDMADTIRKNLWKIPRDIDFIVAIPRSGMICGSLIASHLNVPLIDINSFLVGMEPYGGLRLTQFNGHVKTNKILVIDDTCFNGTSMKATKAKILSSNIAKKYQITYMVVYLEGKGESNIDLYLEDVRMFTNGFRDVVFYEWNILQHGEAFTRCYLFDMDGVLCKNPPDERNESEYLSFIKQAPPLFTPRTTIGGICTYRLMKNKEITEKWLSENGVSYEQLFLFNANTWEERNKSGITPWQYKSYVYSKNNRFKLFIESDDAQAQKIATATKKPVYCVETNKMY